MQINVNNEKDTLKKLTCHNNRVVYLEDLQDRFRGLNKFISDHDAQKQYTSKLMNEYSNMIDIGITKVPRFDKGIQTDLSFMSHRGSK